MFASKSLPEHLLRGIVGLGAIAGGLWAAPQHPWLALLALAAALVALRGCPTCWLLGLAQTVAPMLGKRAACGDGSCREPRSSKL